MLPNAHCLVLQTDPIPELKRQLATTLVEALKGWTTAEAFCAFQIDPPRLCDLRRGRLRRFSSEQLVRLLSRAGHRVTVVIEKERR